MRGKEEGVFSDRIKRSRRHRSEASTKKQEPAHLQLLKQHRTPTSTAGWGSCIYGCTLAAVVLFSILSLTANGTSEAISTTLRDAMAFLTDQPKNFRPDKEPIEFKSMKEKVLLVIPGIGLPVRLRNVVGQLKDNFRFLGGGTRDSEAHITDNEGNIAVGTEREKAMPAPTRSWECVAFVYADDDNREFWVESLPFLRELQLRCDVVRWPGGYYTHFLKALSPTMVSRYNRVLVLMDDIILDTPLHNFRIEEFIAQSDRHNLTVASPGITGSGAGGHMWPSNHSHPTYLRQKQKVDGTVGRLVNSLEVQLTLFDIPSFVCFWELLDVKRNFYGWHYDSYFYEFCRDRVKGFRMGIFDNMEVWHAGGMDSWPGFLGVTSKVHGRVKNKQAEFMEEWWATYRNVSLRKLKRAVIGYLPAD